ncbi:hypothetical protein R6L23_09995 [Streptomyces sp. SR27]|uniref:hypothetical protein n=1 Tax=Streptomyces sp. SR27 TaxID=3076630 RepID=UPI00295B1C38|nr:hypothetical protein [Streptomyces sp. SR27]MDV9188543.1 hypothetical protein [Streptomyces sp. SR27]
MTLTRIADILGRDTFPARTLHRDHLHVPGAIESPADLFSFDVLSDLIARHRLESLRLRLYADGEAIPAKEYTEPVTTPTQPPWHRVRPELLREHLEDGASLILDKADDLHEPLSDFAAELEQWLHANVQVNTYASWTSGSPAVVARSPVP